MDAFLHSGTNHIEQPLLPDPVQVEASQIELLEDVAMAEFTQRKSSRLANKAKSRVGKDILMVAQDLLIKKLGDLPPRQDDANEVNIESFSQHLDNPLNKAGMDAIQELIEHGAKLEKKTGKNKVAAKNMRAA